MNNKSNMNEQEKLARYTHEEYDLANRVSLHTCAHEDTCYRIARDILAHYMPRPKVDEDEVRTIADLIWMAPESMNVDEIAKTIAEHFAAQREVSK